MKKLNLFVVCLIVIVNQLLITYRSVAYSFSTVNRHKLTIVVDKDSLMPVISLQVSKKEYDCLNTSGHVNLSQLLSIRNIQGDDTAALEISGNYHWKRNTLVLQPMVILFPESVYLIRWKNEMGQYCSFLYKTPKIPSLAQSIVTNIYPQVDTIPENILFFHVRFSQKMSPSVFAWKNVHIRETGGKEIDLAWRQKSHWADSNRLLFVMIHPGRVKRAIHYKGQLLSPNKSYVLEIDSSIKDLQGNSIAGPFKKTFWVRERDSILPKVMETTKGLKANTKIPYTITFSETMDYGNIEQGIRVIRLGVDSVAIPVKLSLLNEGKKLLVSPLVKWKKGSYILRITAITDLAINSLRQFFETQTIDDQLENMIPIDYHFNVK